MKKTVIVLGSSRRNGNTGQLVDVLAEKLNADVIDVSAKKIAPYDYEHQHLDDDFLPVIKALLDYDNIMFASPVYWYAMSAQLKIFFDRMTDFLSVDALKDIGRSLRGKTGFVISTSESNCADDSFVSPFVVTFRYLGMEYGGAIHTNCHQGFIASDFQEEIEVFSKKENSGLGEY